MSDDKDADDIPGADDESILKLARERYKSCQDASGDNEVAAIDDLNFLAGGDNQWDATALNARRLQGRPVITVNTLPTYLHQVTNDQRMNTPAIKVHPAGSGASVEKAKVRQGMIRHIEYESNADVAYDTAVNSAAAVGFGYFRLVTDYASETGFDQKIMFRRIRNALSVKIDPLSVDPDGSDMQYCFIESKMSKQLFRKEWPSAKLYEGGSEFNDEAYATWFNDTEVLVCEYYAIEQTDATAVLLSNGESGFKDDLIALPPGVTVVSERKTTRSKVMLYKITGCEILERTEILCRWIPVFPVYGDEIDIQGKIVRSGIIRHAKAPARMYNVFMTSATEEVGARSKTPYIGAEGQFSGHEAEWADANSVFPYREYKPVTLDGNLAPPPMRQPMADIPAGWMMLASHASDNIKRTTGLFDASLGARGTATSGVQEKAQQAEGDMANYHYADGLLRTIRHAGRCLDCMITNYYDGERTVPTMSEDNQVSHTVINDGSPDTDMTLGEYGITISAGASYSTLRQENAEFFTRAMQSAKDPATASVVTYLAMKNNDAPGADEATAMLKALLPPNVVAAMPSDKKNEPVVNTPHGPLPVPQAEQAIAQMSQQLEAMHEALQKADAAKQQLDAMKQQQVLNEQHLEPKRLEVEQMRIGAEVEKAKAAAISAEADLLRAQAEAAAAPNVARLDEQRAETEHMAAQVGLLQEAEKLKLDAMKLEVESKKADAELMESGLNVLTAKAEVARMIEEMRRNSLGDIKVTAPSGNVYDVKLGA